MSRPDVAPVLAFLSTPTPDAWLEEAARQLPVLLADHANCEKKAASTAISLTFKYVDQTELLYKMSRLAREELRHFEQVLDLMAERGIAYQQLGSARYAGALHQLVRHAEPQRLMDLLVLGAVVEARSCERFYRLMDVLPEEVAALYRQLLNSEARHFEEYLSLARGYGSAAELEERCAVFLAKDAELVESRDTQFRFHSGVPG